MSANITINLSGLGLPKPTRDAGFDESKVKRNHGQFASSGGASSHGEAESHHSGKQAEHLKKAKEARKAGNSALGGAHKKAAEAHKKAAYWHQTLQTSKAKEKAGEYTAGSHEKFQEHAKNRADEAKAASEKADNHKARQSRPTESTAGTDKPVKGSWKEQHSGEFTKDPTEGKKPTAQLKLSPKMADDLDASKAVVHHVGEGDKARTHLSLQGGGQSHTSVVMKGHHDPEKALTHYHKSQMRGV